MSPALNPADWRFCVAPMMGWTDRHYRYFARLLSKRARLYTEMLVAAALIHGDPARLLRHHPAEAPVALHLGGCDPQALATASAIGERAGFCEINLNVGCPSDRVQAGRFGACLIAEPALVADCVAAMVAAVRVPVTVKTRLGVDQHDSYDHLAQLVAGVRQAGAQVLILHARKAILGLDTRENRLIPPLDYDRVHRIKQDFPDLIVVLNGGLRTLAEAKPHLAHIDGVMLGRAAYEQPMLLADVDAQLFAASDAPLEADAAVRALLPYIDTQLAQGTPLRQITQHLLGLFAGQPGARDWRRRLSEDAPRSADPHRLLLDGLSQLAQAGEALQRRQAG